MPAAQPAVTRFHTPILKLETKLETKASHSVSSRLSEAFRMIKNRCYSLTYL